MLRCNECKYQKLPPNLDFSKVQSFQGTFAAAPDALTMLRRYSLKLAARRAYNATPEAKGEHCYQCGHVFDLDDKRWAENSYELVGYAGNYQRKEPKKIRTLRDEMMVRASNGNAEARTICERLGVPESEWKGYGQIYHERMMKRVFGEDYGKTP